MHFEAIFKTKQRRISSHRTAINDSNNYSAITQKEKKKVNAIQFQNSLTEKSYKFHGITYRNYIENAFERFAL